MSSAAPLLSVVVLTYEWPEALDVALRALSEEEDQPFEVVVADDGSGPATACVVERWRSELSVPLLHVRHEDRGWRKCRIVNLAAVAARGDYLLFVDGDCLGRRGFLRATRRGTRRTRTSQVS